MKPFSLCITSWLTFCASATPLLKAQPPTITEKQSDNTQPIALDAVVVTANRSQQTLFQQVQPATLLVGDDLQNKLQPTLGETLNREVGVSSTSFGPGASRPIVRGLGDDRVRILQNGTSVLDVSNVSPDHAVAVDPLTISSVEVVRGPASLLFGPNTIGGVVNVIDDRIPQEPFSGTHPSGKISTSAGSVDDLFTQSGAITWGRGPLVFHLDGFNRQTDDIDIPGYARSAALRKASPLPAGEKEARGTLPNSATSSKGAGLGGSYFWDGGFVGFSYSGVDSTYGTVAEPDVTIELNQRRWEMNGAVYTPASWIAEIDVKLGFSDYNHTEFEGSDPGTLFLIKGHNGRVELMHEAIGRLEGAFGFESQYSEFSALGEEAFLPQVENAANSLFFFEEIPVDHCRFQVGARYDHQSNETQSDKTFGPGLSRNFAGISTSGGVVYEPVDDYAVALSLAHTQRPPTYVELFANGPHVATGTFERGDNSLDTEEALSLDLSLRKRSGRVTGSIGGFYYRFHDFISSQPTGSNDPKDNLPIYAYQAVPANFWGGEAEATFHLLEPVKAPRITHARKGAIEHPAISPQRLDLIWRTDFVNAENRDTDEAIPRLPPWRTSLTLDYGYDAFSAQLEGQYAAAQHRHADNELPTADYFLLNAGLSYKMTMGESQTTFHLKATNLTNAEARQSTSILKDVSPVAGRGVVAGVTLEF